MAAAGADEELAVRRLLVQYCRGVDRCDAALIEGCFVEDARLEYGGFTGTAREFCDFAIGWSLDNYAATVHTLGNMVVEALGDVLHVESQVRAVHLDERGERHEASVFLGRYLDVLRHNQDGWRIQHRRVVADIAGRVAMTDGSNMGAVRSARDTSDASYAFFAL